jgi:hypothetical protein
MKTILILVLTGALAGAVLASWIVPSALAWYVTPGGLPQGAEVQAVVQISEVIRYTTSRLIRGQMIGAVVGGSLGLALGIFGHVRSRRSPLPQQPPPPPAPPPPTRTTPA